MFQERFVIPRLVGQLNPLSAADSSSRANEERRVARHTATRLRAAAQAGRRLVAARDPESVERELLSELISLGVDRVELWHEHDAAGWRLNRAKGVPLREQTDVLLEKAAASGNLVSLDLENADELQQAHTAGLDAVVAIPFTKPSDGILRIWSKSDRLLGEAERGNVRSILWPKSFLVINRFSLGRKFGFGNRP